MKTRFTPVRARLCVARAHATARGTRSAVTTNRSRRCKKVLPAMPVRCVLPWRDAATTERYTLSLHDALPILRAAARPARIAQRTALARPRIDQDARRGER